MLTELTKINSPSTGHSLSFPKEKFELFVFVFSLKTLRVKLGLIFDKFKFHLEN